MIIQNNNIYKNRALSPAYINRTSNRDISGISFRGTNIIDVFEPQYTSILSKFKDFTIEEYKALTQHELEVLREAYKKSFRRNIRCGDELFTSQEEKLQKYREFEIFHDEFSESLKNYFDKKYGSGNYGIIIIGRSLSSIGKALGYKIGEHNVKNIPLSKAGRYQEESKMRELKGLGYISRFREYLNSIGLNKQDIQSSGKKYVILDYCLSGNSLSGATSLLTRDDVLGKKNIRSKNVLDCIKDKKLKQLGSKLLFYCQFKDFSLVEPAYWLDDIPNRYKDLQKEDSSIRLFWFKLLDNEMQKQGPKTVEKPGLWESILNFFI